MHLRAAVWLVTLTLVAAALSPARADDATSLLAKHRAFVGWQFGDGSITTLVLDGKETSVEDGSTKTDYAIHAEQAGLAKRTTYTDAADKTVTNSGFTGKIFWATNENGFIRPELGDRQKYNISHDIVFNEETTGFVGQLRDTKVVDGVTTSIVRIAPDAGDPIDLYVDPATGAYKRVVIDPDGTYEASIDILAYANALPGKKIISKWQYTGGKETAEWSSISANAAVTSEQLHPPAPTAIWSFDDRPVPITVNNADPVYTGSVRFAGGKRAISVDATFNGVPGHFIIDTGADGILLLDEYAARIHAKKITTSAASGIGDDTLKTTVKRVDTMTIGHNTLSNAIVTSGDLDFGTGVDGLLGFDLFAGAVVDMNLDSGQLTLHDPATYEPDASQGVVMTVDLTTGQPSVPMKLDGLSVNAILDSGNSANVAFSPDLQLKYGLRMLARDTIGVGGVGGGEMEACGRVNAISIGPIVYDNAPACESPSLSGRDILVGFDFLKNFNFIFNYPQAQLILIPRKH